MLPPKDSIFVYLLFVSTVPYVIFTKDVLGVGYILETALLFYIFAELMFTQNCMNLERCVYTRRAEQLGTGECGFFINYSESVIPTGLTKTLFVTYEDIKRFEYSYEDCTLTLHGKFKLVTQLSGQVVLEDEVSEFTLLNLFDTDLVPVLKDKVVED